MVGSATLSVSNDRLATPVASMDSHKSASSLRGGYGWRKTADGHSTRSAEKLILSVLKRSLKDLVGVSQSLVQLVESLIWPFVSRRSLRKEWFSQQELDRFVCSMRKTAQTIQSYMTEDNREQSYIKYWTDRYLCQVFSDTSRKDSFPDSDGWMDQKPLFSGWCKNFIVRRRNKGDISFFYTLQKGIRKMWPALGDVKKEAALKKHALRLSTFKGFVDDKFQDMIQTISRQVAALSSKKSATKFMPSGSACSQASRRNGGALSLFAKLPLVSCLASSEAVKIGRLPVVNAAIMSWRNSNFDSAYSSVINRLSDTDERGNFSLLSVDVVAIPEPGKFRIISKGDGYLYSALQPLQGLMLDGWKHHSASTMLHEDLSERVREIDMGSDFPFWISVDYEAATDLMKRDSTLAAMRGFEGFPFFDLGWHSLSASSARYPNGEVCDAIEGQLMGHPLSFPLLCIVNLAAYQRSLEIWYLRDPQVRKPLLRKLKGLVIVNGDDMLFKADMELYEIFSEISASAGFKKSQGKNYVSPDCCMINSQIFKRIGMSMQRFGYLNLKMIKGTNLKGGDSDATPTDIAKELSKMVSLCPWSSCSIPSAFKRWSPDWYGLRNMPNWYLPVMLGGLGLDPAYGPAEIRVTRAQRLLAARFVSDPRLALYRKTGMKIPVLSGAVGNWKVLKGANLRSPHDLTENDSDEWLARLAYAARAAYGSQPTSDAKFMRWILNSSEYRLKPMSIEAIQDYFGCGLFAARTPSCPPMGVIRNRNMYDIEVSQNLREVDSYTLLGIWERSKRIDSQKFDLIHAAAELHRCKQCGEIRFPWNQSSFETRPPLEGWFCIACQ